jgi:hypothetical protein
MYRPASERVNSKGFAFAIQCACIPDIADDRSHHGKKLKRCLSRVRQSTIKEHFCGGSESRNMIGVAK